MLTYTKMSEYHTTPSRDKINTRTRFQRLQGKKTKNLKVGHNLHKKQKSTSTLAAHNRGVAAYLALESAVVTTGAWIIMLGSQLGEATEIYLGNRHGHTR